MELNQQTPIHKIILRAGLGLILLMLVFAAGYISRDWFPLDKNPFPLFQQAYDILEQNGLSPLPEQPKLEHGMIKGMLEAYGDPYTVFLEPPQHELQSNQLQGHFGGIGARLELDSEGYLRVYPFPDSPADKAGVMEGDRLEQVDQLIISANPNMDEVNAAISGLVGSIVNVTISRPADGLTKTLQIKREDVALPSITYHLLVEDPRVGIVQVNIIAATTTGEIRTAIHDLEARGAEYFILDLRNNGGGLVDSGVNIARLFLEDGDVISQQYRGRSIDTFSVTEAGEFADLPLVVLVNQSTASASEIVAGALQAHHRALLIGEPTFGKNSIQLIFDLRDGSSLHVTAAHWWIDEQPADKLTSRLTPDILIPAEQADEVTYLRLAVSSLTTNPNSVSQGH